MYSPKDPFDRLLAHAESECHPMYKHNISSDYMTRFDSFVKDRKVTPYKAPLNPSII